MCGSAGYLASSGEVIIRPILEPEMKLTVQNIYSRAARVAMYSDLHATRFSLGVAEFLWAVTLLWPGDTFGRPTYTVMARVMSEEAWGLLFLMSSITQFSILLSMRYHDRFAVMFAGWNAMLWGFVTISMYLSVSPPPAAISGEAALSIAAFWVYIRSGYVFPGNRLSDKYLGDRTNG